jgi:hypothetical protein
MTTPLSVLCSSARRQLYNHALGETFGKVMKQVTNTAGGNGAATDD